MQLDRWLRNNLLLLICVGCFAICGSAQQSTYVTDRGGQVFNVKAYGAKGDGTTDDTAAVNSAISAAQVTGGVLYFPPGVYEVKNPNQVNPSNMLSGHTVVSIRCTSATSTVIQFTGTAGFLVSNVLRIVPYYGGDISGCQFDLTKASIGAIALHLIDTVGFMIHNNSFLGASANSDVGIELENSTAWSERNQIVGNQFNELTNGIEFLQDSGDTSKSFDYNIIRNNHFQIPGGSNGILFTGPLNQTNGDIIEGLANFDGTSAANFLRASNTASLSQMTVRLGAETDGATLGALVCGDTGTVWHTLTGWLFGFSGELSECSGGVSIQFTGYGPQENFGGTVFNLGNKLSPGGGGTTFSVQWTSGPAAPTGSCQNGSLFSNTATGAANALYVCQAGAWAAK